jgi:fused signal recognition particle receptor
MSFCKKLFRRTGSADEPAAPDEPRPAPPSPAGEPEPVDTVEEPFVPPLPPPSPAPFAPDAETGDPRLVAPLEPSGAPPLAEAGWLSRLKDGLSKTSRSLSSGITDIFTKRRLNDATLAELEDILIGADLGTEMSARIAAAVGRGRYDREIDPAEVKRVLADEIAAVLRPVEVPFAFEASKRPFVILVVGVNGSGKTTTIGKLAAIARREGFAVTVAACDTFRAAAIEQLHAWALRIGATIVARQPGADAAGVAFDALTAARASGADILIIDTAGRLQNKANLMAELEKIIRVLKKQDAALPHATLLVLDATTGQNALNQVEMFHKTAGVTGLIMTKLDGTARGGILVAIAERFALPVHAIGVGERTEDLQPFDARAFSRAIAGLDIEESERT